MMPTPEVRNAVIAGRLLIASIVAERLDLSIGFPEIRDLRVGEIVNCFSNPFRHALVAPGAASTIGPKRRAPPDRGE
jgi:hypothetical protein